MSPFSYAQRTLAFDDHFCGSFKKVEERANNMILFYMHVDVALIFFFSFEQSLILCHSEAKWD